MITYHRSWPNFCERFGLQVVDYVEPRPGIPPTPSHTLRRRLGNRTQIFTAAVRVSGSDLAVRKLSVQDELDYQKQERLRELLRDLENTVVNGILPAADAEGSATVRRTPRTTAGN